MSNETEKFSLLFLDQKAICAGILRLNLLVLKPCYASSCFTISCLMGDKVVFKLE